MKIQPIVTTGITDKGNEYKKSNAGKYLAAGELSAIAATSVLIAAAKKPAAKAAKTAEKVVKSSSLLDSVKEGVGAFFKHPLQSIKDFGKNFTEKVNLESIKKAGTNLMDKAKALSPTKKAILVSAALVLVANLGFDFIFNKISAHKADKNA